MVQLRVAGLRPATISLDDYFVDNAKTPRDKAGNHDFEHIEAIDIRLFNRHLLDLIAGREIELPYFNFATKSREFRGTKLKIDDDQIVIIEGIGLLAGAVWAVGQIKATTGSLKVSLDNLTGTMEKVETVVARLDTHTNDHEARLRVLEARPRGRTQRR